MPPGFMNATTDPPKSVGAVVASWASAMTSPSGCSPAGDGVRVMSVVIEPTTRLAIGPASACYFCRILVSAGSLATSRVTMTLRAAASETSLVRWSSVSSMSVTRRPNDAALVTILPPMRQL